MLAAFKKINIQEPHLMTKSETHLIESSNSSIRDNLARFNRKTKRYSKSLEMLKIALDLFLYKDFILNEMLIIHSLGERGRGEGN